MVNSTVSPPRQLEGEREIWESLQQAIAASSGFRRWQQEQPDGEWLPAANLEAQVRRYLRETLATLAY
jgi:hypothetical protein